MMATLLYPNANTIIVEIGVATAFISANIFKKIKRSLADIMQLNTVEGKVIARFIVHRSISHFAVTYSDEVKPSAKTSFKLKVKNKPQAKAIEPRIVKINKNRPFSLEIAS